MGGGDGHGGGSRGWLELPACIRSDSSLLQSCFRSAWSKKQYARDRPAGTPSKLR
ncbi:hypothetical protein HMPREF9440_01599 [Sutterella parvirubra YIT 11816]|uniref:Uncharacterized protein n=1 Tax=Sutterella parvirubra YIT 11816 TaxID=762967 RepID=H3KFS9_9BURK|nr:hypothetical protein HMPREF9440_01599 [Sutterella parvirubra YIT 11816]